MLRQAWLWIGVALAAWGSSAVAQTHEWKSIGKYGCYGLPDARQDPHNPDNYIIIWQRYADRPAGHTVEDVKFATYNAKTKTFSRERYAFDPGKMTIMQGHPCWGYSHGKCRVFYCQKSAQGDFIAEVTADKWSDLQSYAVSNNESVVTPDLQRRPHMEFLPGDNSSPAWFFYTMNNRPSRISYSVFHGNSGWEKTAGSIPTSTLVGTGKQLMGSAMREGDNVVLYSSVPNGDNAGKAYRFRTNDLGKTWTADQLSVSGIDQPFKYNIDGQLFTRVVKKGNTYYMSSQSHSSHRWLAKSDDGVNFNLVKDFGKRRSLGNAMVNIEGTNDILLIYASYVDGKKENKNIECLVYENPTPFVRSGR